MALTKVILLLVLVSLGYCQQLNGHINPMWLSSTRRDDAMSRGIQQTGSHINSLWMSARTAMDRSPLLQLYFLDSGGTFRPLTLQNPTLPLYRGSERDYNVGSSARYERLPTPYGNTNY